MTMPVHNWTAEDTARARQYWAEYQRTHDVSGRTGLTIAGHSWSAIIDTGFNGDLELPETLRPLLNARPHQRIRSLLAGGRLVDEDSDLVDFSFDGGVIVAEATFVPGIDILIGTHL